MILIACIDENGGLAFNRRRQSMDAAVRERILALSQGGELWMSPYSARQFGEDGAERLTVSEAFLSEAPAGAYCFVETDAVGDRESQVEKAVLFHWNRSYPADLFLALDLREPPWRCTLREDFAGRSHERITMEVYER